jgi:hypothetical protein
MKRTDEHLREVNGYEGRYWVSDMGNVYSLYQGDGGNMTLKRLAPHHIKCGYYFVALSKNGIKSFPHIHKLVCAHFCPGWKPGLQVNHKNGIKTDNRAENLEWITASENMLHAYYTLHKRIKPAALCQDGKIVKAYMSLRKMGKYENTYFNRTVKRHGKMHGLTPKYITFEEYEQWKKTQDGLR